MSILEKTALEQQALNVIDRINAQQISPVIFFDTQQTSEPLPVTASKVGGVPYVPVGTAAPTNCSGQNLGLIAQINCSELPTNDIYPETGILQFWLDPHVGAKLRRSHQPTKNSSCLLSDSGCARLRGRYRRNGTYS